MAAVLQYFWISLYENCFSLIEPWPSCPLTNNPALIHLMAWLKIGDTPLTEAMMASFVSLLMHMCIIQTRISW